MKKALIIILSILVAIGLLGVAGWYVLTSENSPLNRYIGQNNTVEIVEKPTPKPVEMVQFGTIDPNSIPTPTPVLTPEPLWAVSQINPDVINLLLIGIDTRKVDADKNNLGASDSMMLVSCNLKTKRVCVFSLLRDGACYPWNKAKRDKINKAYANGGVTNLMNNVINGSKNFALDVQLYISVNFFMFMDIVDEFGGIPIDLTKEEVDFINNKIAYESEVKGSRSYMPNTSPYLVSKDGIQYLTGEQALWYARDRYSANLGDVGRTARQRNVLMTLYEVAKEEWTVAKLTKVAEYVTENSMTNITADRLIQLATIAMNGDFRIESTTIPFPGMGHHGQNDAGNYMIDYDMKKTREMLHEIIYEGAPMPGQEDDSLAAGAPNEE